MTSLPFGRTPLSTQVKPPLSSKTSNVVPGDTSTFVYGTFFTQSRGICSAFAAAQVEDAGQIGAEATMASSVAPGASDLAPVTGTVLSRPPNVGIPEMLLLVGS